MQPQVPYPTPEQIESARSSNKKKFTWGLICLIGPTVIIVLSIILAFASNAIRAATPSYPTYQSDGVVMTERTSFPATVLTAASFMAGAIGFITWLPGIIAGIVLLVSRTRTPPYRE